MSWSALLLRKSNLKRNYFMKLSHSIALLLAAVLLSACSFSLAADITPPPDYKTPTALISQSSNNALYPIVAPDPASGSAIFAQKCAPCHGTGGKGDGPMAGQLPNPVPAIGSATIANQSIPVQWYNAITQGNLDRGMPPFSSLSDRQRWDVLAYVYSLSSTANSQTAQLYQQDCASCHGDKGQGSGPSAAGLGSSPAGFTDQAAMVQKSQANLYQAISNGVSPDMPAFADKLSDADRQSLADYVRSLSFASAGVQANAGTPSPDSTVIAQAPAASSGITSTNPTTSTQIFTGTVTGHILNNSGEGLPKDLEISLHGFDGTTLVVTGTTKVKADGTYSFPNIQMATNRAFIASTNFNNTTYGSEVATVQNGTKSMSLDISIFDSTTDQSSLSVDRLHLFFDFSNPGTVQIIELYIISNNGKKTVVGKDTGGPVVSFTLPKGATNLQFQDSTLGGRYVQTADGFADTVNVTPGQGQYQVMFAFDLPYTNKLDLSQPLKMPVDAVVLLMPESGIKVKGSNVQDSGTQNVQGASYHMYSGGKLAAGSSLTLTLSGRPGSGASILSNTELRNNLAIGLGALGIVLVVLAIWLYRRQSRSAEEDEEEIEPEDEAEYDTEDGLMDAIIALDDQYKAGELPEEAYAQRRAELKERLRLLSEKEASGDGNALGGANS